MQARPSVETLADAAGVSPRTAGRALLRLEAAGYLAVSWSRGRSTHVFTLTTPKEVQGNSVADSGLNSEEIRGRLP